jgi:hypothetical protein
MYSQYLAFAEAHRGREEEYADWYKWVHFRDVLRPRAAGIAGQIFQRIERDVGVGGPPRYSYRFLGTYEITDPVAMTYSDAPDPATLLITSAADFSVGTAGGYYDTAIEKTKTPGEWPDADLIIEWIEPPEPNAEAIRAYVDNRFLRLMGKAEVVRGWLGKASAHQAIEEQRPALVAFYRTTDLDESLRGWSEGGGEVPFPFSAACFRAVSKRVTRDELLKADAATLAREAEARKAVDPLVA